ncbi:ABC transporter ATP-binding protein [Mesorhizobium sp. CO1-1-8]|uniref:ABC transporter ATP-binding protein n=1 Tax=Mesorhizobium sp. CO1-1-8 TaxID=2876631 RepID=UPI001CD0F9FD|nr:ABC transporter ATP-binding protein [Mesorhizobium sp. CO1-1-8]MBZ9772379.1 ABC transporter ATP-binding protein [Mesorhizobium sp. CO1-1-8]
MLQVDGLTTHYGRIQAISKVAFRVEEREIVTLIGSNGAGKSTTLMTISGVLKPSGGRIGFRGTALHGMAAHEVARLGVVQVPEGRRIFPRLTVLENLDLGGFVRTAREREATLSRVYGLFPRLAERRNQLGGTLSGGEQQMLAIGRALMAKPILLILDEPSLGLAPKIIEQIFEIIQALNKEGMTILLVEQNATMALEIAHRAYVLETGKIVAQGSARSLSQDPSVRQAYLGL